MEKRGLDSGKDILELRDTLRSKVVVMVMVVVWWWWWSLRLGETVGWKGWAYQQLYSGIEVD